MHIVSSLCNPSDVGCFLMLFYLQCCLFFSGLCSHVAASFCDDEGLSGTSGGSNECVMNLSPRGTKYWIPSCDEAR